jgi:eukaryotic-like serine/threonine-protein kinase
MKSLQPSRVRFGAFELDLRSGELRPLVAADDFRAVVLQEQPFQVLCILIERNGEVATREEIKNKLWPNDTAVDFNHSINVAIATLRRALRDSVEKPQYIATVARRGYRLIAAAEWAKTTDEVLAGDDNGSGQRRPTDSAGLIGKKVSHYRVLEVIGGGGMGMVYKAEDLRLGRRVALKFLPDELTSDEQALRRFEREAQTASSLNHAHICTIYEIEEYAGQPFIAMELLEGETLRDRLAASGSRALPLAELLDIAVQTCAGLKAAHGQGIIHRDIKPANIFLTRQGPVKILDFGLAKLAALEGIDETDARVSEGTNHSSGNSGQLSDSSGSAKRKIDATLTRTGMAIGTAGYMSPEQIRREPLDARTDLFSFGLVFYEMATGRRAFAGDTVEVLHHAILNQATPPMSLAAGLEAIIAKALEKDRVRRYQSAGEMRVDIELFRTKKRPPVRRPTQWLVAISLILAVVAGGWSYWRTRKPAGLSANDAVVLADINNQTSDPVFDDALNTAMRVEFEQTPFFNVLAADKVRGTLKLLNRPLDGKLTLPLAREVCVRTNSRVVIATSIADQGNHFRLELAGIECSSGKIVATANRDVPDRDQIVQVLGVLGSQLRNKLGEPRTSVMRFDRPLDEATSSSLEALQLLTEGYRRHMRRDNLTASYYQQAIERDPNFALAYVSLGAWYQNGDDLVSAAAAEKKAYDLRSRLTEQAGFLAETLYDSLAIGDLETAYPLYERWLQTFPLDVRGHLNFNVCLQALGQHQRAVTEAREAVRLLPSFATYINLVQSAIFADRTDEAKTALDQAQARGIDGPRFHDARHRIAFLEHDEPAMRAQLAWAMNQRGAEDVLLALQAGAEFYYGRFRSGQRLMRQAMESAKEAGGSDAEKVYRWQMAIQQAEVGDLATAQGELRGAAAPKGPERAQWALVLARCGELEQARRQAEMADQERPRDTLVQKHSLPAIRAAIKLLKNDQAGAIQDLQPALRYDFANPPDFMTLYPAYLRGLAYLRMNQGQMAASEFHKVLDHPGLAGRFVTGSLSRLQLGRAQTMMGDRAAARKSYQDFLKLWKDADPEIPIYQEAKAEYAKLE